MDLGPSYKYFCNISSEKLKVVFNCGKSATIFHDLPKLGLEWSAKKRCYKICGSSHKKKLDGKCRHFHQWLYGHWQIGAVTAQYSMTVDKSDLEAES
jgi:hypothetical protein